MVFIVIAYDGTDENALQRRTAIRPQHLKLAEGFHKNGKWLYAAGILNEKGDLAGSMIVCEFDSKEEMKREWLDHEPYLLGGVWKKVDIHPALIPPFYLNRSSVRNEREKIGKSS
jgi:uncharacterized protein YciI